MPNFPDDPRLTAYALGELDEAERLELEGQIADDPEALALVADLRATASLLTEHLQAEPRPSLETSQRQAIETRLEPVQTLKPKHGHVWVKLAVAASLIGITTIMVLPAIQNARRPDRRGEIARNLTVASPESIDPARSEEPPLTQTRKLLVDAEANPRVVLPRAPSPSEAQPVRRIQVQTEDGKPSAASPAPLADAAPAPPSQAGRSAFANEREAAKPSPSKLASSSPASSDQKAKAPANPGQALSRAAKPGQGRPNNEAKPNQAPFRTHGGLGPESPAPPAVPNGQARNEKEEGFLNELHLVDGSMAANNDPSKKDAESPKNFKQMSDRRRRLTEELAKAKADADAVANGEGLAPIVDNAFRPVNAEDPSTFSIDCDTASYTHVRRILNQGVIPPKDAVRIEELINYFPYAYPAPKGDDPFSVNVEVARCPWDAGHRLVRIGLKGREIVQGQRPPSNLVFLIDVSGSMDELDKLPMLKAGMKLMVDALGENDRVAIVVYAAREGLVLSSTSCVHKGDILAALDNLQAGGSTNGGSGIMLAYDVAVQNFIKGGTNRVILCTDGDFNVGVTEGPDLDALIEKKRESGVFLSVFGFGQGNVKHDRLERLADRGNGQYCYIDSIKEARKVLVDQIGSTLVTIAKDVKIQVKFNPAKVAAYRLIGYENRVLAARDFQDDKKDAGEIGASHCVTALYEVIPPGQGGAAAPAKGEMLNVDLRCKAPDGDVSKLFQCPADDDGRDFAAASVDFKFASSVAGFGMMLRDSPYKGTLTWPGLLELAAGGVGNDPTGYRNEFLGLIRKAQAASSR